MRRGFTTISILLFIILMGSLVFGAFYLFDQQKIKAINSFEECVKLFPVMESYPAQCNTPDGKHFVQELSDEEKQKLVSSKKPEATNSASLVDTPNWKTYTNEKFTLKYANKFIFSEETGGSGNLKYYYFKSDDEIYRFEVGPLGYAGWYDHFNSKETESVGDNLWTVIPSTEYCDAGSCGMTAEGYFLKSDNFFIGVGILENKGTLVTMKEFLKELKVLE